MPYAVQNAEWGITNLCGIPQTKTTLVLLLYIVFLGILSTLATKMSLNPNYIVVNSTMNHPHCHLNGW